MKRFIIATESEVFWGGVFTFLILLAIGTYALVIGMCIIGIYLLFTNPKSLFFILITGAIMMAFTRHPAISGGVVAFLLILRLLVGNNTKPKTKLLDNKIK